MILTARKITRASYILHTHTHHAAYNLRVRTHITLNQWTSTATTSTAKSLSSTKYIITAQHIMIKSIRRTHAGHSVRTGRQRRQHAMTVSELSTKLPTALWTQYIKHINSREPPMVIDNYNVFSTNNELLTEVSQFIVCLNNRMVSDNVNFAKRTGLNTFDTFVEQVTEEINEYKVYDCWGDFPSSLTQTHSSQNVNHHWTFTPGCN